LVSNVSLNSLTIIFKILKFFKQLCIWLRWNLLNKTEKKNFDYKVLSQSLQLKFCSRSYIQGWIWQHFCQVNFGIWSPNGTTHTNSEFSGYFTVCNMKKVFTRPTSVSDSIKNYSFQFCSKNSIVVIIK
jgi:hypothetical protein